MKQLLQTILEPMLEHPEILTLSVEETPSKVVYHIDAHESDIGRIIGRRGRMIKAVRTIMSSSNNDHKKRVFVDVD